MLAVELEPIVVVLPVGFEFVGFELVPVASDWFALEPLGPVPESFALVE